MAKATNFRPYGDAVLSRLGAVPADLRAAVQAHIDAFAEAHAAYEGLCDRADSGREARDNALAAVGTADKALDAAVLRLADALVGAGIGARKNPFAKFGPHAPGKVNSRFSPNLLRSRIYKTNSYKWGRRAKAGKLGRIG